MHKKEIYDYLAKTYLTEIKDTRLNKFIKKDKKYYRKIFLLTGVFSLALILAILSLTTHNKSNLNAKVTNFDINLPGDIIRLNYNFFPAKDAINRVGFTVRLNKFDARSFKFFTLSAQKTRNPADLTLRVDLENKKGESSTAYIYGITNKWQDFKIALTHFKNISDFSGIIRIKFIVERWNAKSEKDVLLLDNLSFSIN